MTANIFGKSKTLEGSKVSAFPSCGAEVRRTLIRLEAVISDTGIIYRCVLEPDSLMVLSHKKRGSQLAC